MMSLLEQILFIVVCKEIFEVTIKNLGRGLCNCDVRKILNDFEISQFKNLKMFSEHSPKNEEKKLQNF